MQTSPPKKPRVLLLSGYDAASHRHWRNTLVNGLNQFDWTEVILPDRYFFWRIRGNGLTFAYQHKEVLAGEYDCLIVTSMVDLATLRGFVPQLATIPNILYVHENQFEYPTHDLTGDNKNIVNAQLTSIYALLCADQVLFNSQFNQQTFFSGAKKLLKKLPDGIPKNLLSGIVDKTQVLPVPIFENPYKTSENEFLFFNQPIGILWNHRWEYDKQPEVFFDAIKRLKRSGFQFKLHVVGQSFRQKPACFKSAEQLFCDEIVSWGYQSKEDYQKILASSELVISTALHDFQGLSMLEAIASGCVPIAPNRVAYPEYIGADNLYLVDSQSDEASALYKKVMAVCTELQDKNRFKNAQKKQQQKINGYFDKHLLIKYAQVITSSIEQFRFKKANR